MNNARVVPAELDFQKLARSLERFENAGGSVKTLKIAVFGDFCLDKYLYVYPSLGEKSVETGLEAFQVRAKRLFPGVGGTIARNLRALGAETYCFGVVGDDGEGFDLLQALRKIGADVGGIVVARDFITGAYVKPMRPDLRRNRDRVFQNDIFPKPDEDEWLEGNRYDFRNPAPAPEIYVDELKRRFLEKLPFFDAVVVSDQFPPGSEAIFSDALRAFLSESALANPDVFFLCDSRFFIDSYRSAVVKCNAAEALDAFDATRSGTRNRETDLDGDPDARLEKIEEAGRWLALRNRRSALVTRGARGSVLFQPDADDGSVLVTAIPSRRVEPPIDVCGAGDATDAGLAFARALGLNLVESAYLAGLVSSITIKQIGVTGVASVKQLLEILRSQKS